MTISLSTQNFADHQDYSALDTMAPLGFTSVFLGPGLWPRTIKRIRKKERPVSALSIFAERPYGLRWDDEPLQKLPLLTTDREMRGRVIEQVIKSFIFAAELGVERLVVPLLTLEDCPRKLLLDAARSVLEPLLDEADRRKVKLCVPFGREDQENSNESIPTNKELFTLFSDFSGAPLFYWHKAKQKENAPPKKLSERERDEQAEREGSRPQQGILITSALSLDLTSYDPVAAAAFASQGGAAPKELGTGASLWQPLVDENFVKQCAGVEVQAHRREDFVRYETEELWVIL